MDEKEVYVGGGAGQGQQQEPSALAMYAMAQDGIQAVDEPFRAESRRLNSDLRRYRSSVLEYLVSNGFDEIEDESTGTVLTVVRGKSFKCTNGDDVSAAGQAALAEVGDSVGKGAEQDDTDEAFVQYIRRRVNTQRKRECLPPLPRARKPKSSNQSGLKLHSLSKTSETAASATSNDGAGGGNESDSDTSSGTVSGEATSQKKTGKKRKRTMSVKRRSKVEPEDAEKVARREAKRRRIAEAATRLAAAYESRIKDSSAHMADSD
jgi:hypothetical protein